MVFKADKFLNKYRISSARASWWNYADSGQYFITICTVRRKHLFGKIKNGEMHLSPIGEIVRQEWNKSFEIRDQLFCDVFVIMPNHIHAILRIENELNTIPPNGPVASVGPEVGTHSCASLQLSGQSTNPSYKQPRSKNQNHGVAIRPPKSISSFVAGFKSAATKRINEFRNTPKTAVWQSRFHDHIIRSEREYKNIYNYIENNPANWTKAKF